MKTTKTNKTTYWISKGFISFFMLFSSWYSFTHAEDFRILGFPNYFRIEISIAKIIGAILLLVPAISLRIKEWIYAGFGICMLSAFIAHICSGDPISKIIFVGVDFVLIVACISYVTKKEYTQLKNINV